MVPESIIRHLWATGVRLELTSDGRLFAKPSELMTDELRCLCRENKAELIEFLQHAECTAQVVIEAAMHACDAWGDGQVAREQMRQAVLETPHHLRDDLLAHFKCAYPACRERVKGEEVQKGPLRRR